ncbi:hypothetical protein CDV31_007518 [Fusarium ambrosium]|uniref:Uncharacterized protein n=1 Tax=Fusarium ambrosium TaxID=131363 RepID=A0A428U6E3_9HYPO|nr:hypothetical protein CDV31_007518 [Fusarium ambrosium]
MAIRQGLTSDPVISLSRPLNDKKPSSTPVLSSRRSNLIAVAPSSHRAIVPCSLRTLQNMGRYSLRGE